MYAQILTDKKQWVSLAVTTFASRYQISAGPPIMSGRSILLTVFSCWDSICKGDWEKLNAGVMQRDMQVHLTLHMKATSSLTNHQPVSKQHVLLFLQEGSSPKLKLFTHPYFVPNLYDLLFSVAKEKNIF